MGLNKYHYAVHEIHIEYRRQQGVGSDHRVSQCPAPLEGLGLSRVHLGYHSANWRMLTGSLPIRAMKTPRPINPRCISGPAAGIVTYCI